MDVFKIDLSILQSKQAILSIGTVGVLLSGASIYLQHVQLQSVAQVIAALSGYLWMCKLSKTTSLMSLLSVSLCSVAAVHPNVWLLFGASTSRAIDYQILLWRSK